MTYQGLLKILFLPLPHRLTLLKASHVKDFDHITDIFPVIHFDSASITDQTIDEVTCERCDLQETLYTNVFDN